MPLFLYAGFFLALPRRIKKRILLRVAVYFSDIGYLPMQDYVIPPSAYCPAAEEVWRAGTDFIDENFIDAQVKDLLKHLRDLFCMIIHFDMAYRFRFQDIVPLFDKSSFRENPKKEIMRVVKIYLARENNEGVTEKWAFVIKRLRVVLWILFSYKKIRNAAVDFMDNLDLNAIAPDEADWYYMLDRKDYDYGGKTYTERMKESFDMDIKAGNRRMKVATEPEK